MRWLASIQAVAALALFSALSRPVVGSTVIGSDCDISLPKQQLLALPACRPTATTVEDARSIGWQFAPIVYWHPLEQWHLQSPDVYYDAADQFLIDYRRFNDSAFQFIADDPLLEVTWGAKSFLTILNSTKLTPEQARVVMAGAPFDANGNSTAKVYFTTHEVAPGLWMYNYNLYYSWNGCSNQYFAASLNGTRADLEYVMCSPGVHESDWERVSVLVCMADQQVMQTAYSQHNWWETRDCAAGQCVLQDGHPVTYAGLESHANQYKASPLLVYEFFNLTAGGFSIDNVGGLYVSDRSLQDPTKRWYPTPSNTIAIPDMEEIYTKNLTEFEWALYTGQWGAPLITPAWNVTCLYDNQTRMGECEDNAVYKGLKAALNIMKVAPFLNKVEQISDSNHNQSDSVNGYSVANKQSPELFGWPDITGPLMRGYSYLWLNATHAPVHNKNTSIACPDSVVITQSVPALPNRDVSVSTIASYIWGIAVGALAFSAVMALVLALPELMRKGAIVQCLYASAASTISAAAIKTGAAFDAATAVVCTTGASAAIAIGDVTGIQTEHMASGKAAATLALAQLDATQPDGRSAVAATAEGDVEVAMQRAVPSKLCEGAAAEADDTASTRTGHSAGGGRRRTVLTKRHMVWGVFAAMLFTAAIVCLAIGANYVFTASIASYTVGFIGSSSSILDTIQIVLGVSLALVGVCDLIIIFIVFLAKPHDIVIGRFKMRGGSKWVVKHAYKIHIAMAALIAFVCSVAMLLFGLGYVVLLNTVALRMICSKVADIAILSVSIQNVCFTVPLVADTEICGWEAIQTCYDNTNLNVVYMPIGAALLLWSHLMWLVAAVTSMWQYFTFEVVRPS